MSKKSKKNKNNTDKKSLPTPSAALSALIFRLREGLLLCLFALSVFILVALMTYHHSDPGWTHAVNSVSVYNAGGRLGAWFSDVFLYLLGYVAYLLPITLGYVVFQYYWHRHREARQESFRSLLIAMRVMGFILVVLTVSALLDLYAHPGAGHLPSLSAGGIVGHLLANHLVHSLNKAGSTLLLMTLMLSGVTLLTGVSWLKLAEMIGVYTIQAFYWMKHYCCYADWRGGIDQVQSRVVSFKNWLVRCPSWWPKGAGDDVKDDRQDPVLSTPVMTELSMAQAAVEVPAVKKNKLSASFKVPRYKKGSIIPPLNLLNKSIKQVKNELSAVQLKAKGEEVEARLSDFGVEVKVVAIHPGPVVTRFELSLAAGTKVNKITILSKDLARSLSVVSVRVVEVIPGKSVVGLELPNQKREVVGLQDVLSTRQYHDSASALTLALGKDIAGHPVVVDLAKMPHLLVAGTTGSGKSVSLNAMLLSLLYKSTPEQLRLIMIDPKMLELAVYDGIPHLLTPVVTDMKQAATALRWCVMEMERRYRLMASLGVRNIAGYNQKVREAKKRGTPLLDPLMQAADEAAIPELVELPQIVVLADEFADMMVVVGKKVETLIARLAQKARAAGVHLIFATQRPSVDVITGLIKANIPTRIAFQVSSKIDSRTILDQQGAEQLLGHGDMLYLAPGTGLPVRVHGAYVDDDEVHRVVAYLKAQGEPEYLDALTDDNLVQDPSGFTQAVDQPPSAESDPYYDEAVVFVTQSRKVSISSVQRRFKIGYNRAASIVEAMEMAGVVSRAEGSGMREVLAPPPPKE